MDHHTKNWVKFFYLLSYFLFPFLTHPSVYPLSFYYSFIVLLWTHLQSSQLTSAHLTSVSGSSEGLYKVQL